MKEILEQGFDEETLEELLNECIQNFETHPPVKSVVLSLSVTALLLKFGFFQTRIFAARP